MTDPASGKVIARRVVLLLWVIHLAPPALLAQEAPDVAFERITTAQGLPFHAVSAVLQDQTGFLWVGTLDGLGRYDGYRFQDIAQFSPDSSGLSDHYVNVLYEDRAGILWIGTRRGLNRKDPTTGRITRYRHDPGDSSSLSHDNVISLVETRDGRLWVGTERGLNRFEPGAERFVRYLPDPADSHSLSGPAVTALVEDRSGSLWAGTRQGLNRHDGDGRFTRLTAQDELPHDDVIALYEDRKGRLWVGTWGGGLFVRDPETGRFAHQPWNLPALVDPAVDDVVALYEDRKGRLWVGTWGGGLLVRDPETGRFSRYGTEANNPTSLSANHIYDLVEDRAGVLWVGTRDGLGKSVLRKPFTVIAPAAGPGAAPAGVSQVYEDAGGALWIGHTGGGLTRYVPDTETVRHYRHDPADPASLSTGDVSGIREDRSGAVWIGTLGGGLNRFDRATETFTHFLHDPDDPQSPGDDRIYSVYEDAGGSLWIGTVTRGLDRFDPATGTFTHYRHDPDDPQRLSYDSVWPVLEDRTGTLWVGTVEGGLNALDRKKGIFTRYRHDPKNPHSLSSDRVIALHEDVLGNLWIGTMGGGLNRFDRDAQQFVRYTVREGLPDNSAVCLLSDNGGNLWIGTSDGLARFDLVNEQFETYHRDDGLPGTSFSFNACHKTARGTMLFGTDRGLVSFAPNRIRSDPQRPPVVITDLELFNEPARLDSSVTHLQEIRLPHDQNFVAFRFAALDFRAPERNVYAYRLEGLERAWIASGDRRYAGYANLRPGRYTFRVKAANSDGVWNEAGAAVRLIITPPWWQAWWAYVLYVVLLLGATTGFAMGVARWKASRLEKLHLEAHARRLAQVDEEKTRFFANITHEFRSPLTLIIGPLKQILAGDSLPVNAPLREQLEMMLRNSQRLMRLINQILDLARLEAGALGLRFRLQDLGDRVRQTVLAFTPLAETQGITLTCIIPDEPCPVYFDAERMEQILANLVSNAIKFTPSGGQVRVNVRDFEDAAEIVVRDTGIGIPPQQREHVFERFVQVDASPTRAYEGTGIGLALVKNLVDLHGGTVGVESREGKGSAFTIRLSKGRAHLPAQQIAGDEERAVVPEAIPEDAARWTAAEGVRYAAETVVGGPATDQNDEGDAEDVTTVLVVDDNADMRAFLRSILEPDFRVLEAEDGARGLVRTKEDLPDLVVADVMMPEMDGFEMNRALKVDPSTDCIPVILLTARATMKDEIEGLNTGADDYVMKPFEAEVLRTRVQNLIGIRKRLRERFAGKTNGSRNGAEPAPPRRRESPFLQSVREAIQENLDDPDFNVQKLADAVNLSESRLYTRVRDEQKLAPVQLIRTMRLERAAVLLKQEEGTISEVAYAVGFNSLAYFCRCFKQHFGETPSAYAERRKG